MGKTMSGENILMKLVWPDMGGAGGSRRAQVLKKKFKMHMGCVVCGYA